MKIFKTKVYKQKGQVIIIAVLFLGIMLTISTALISYTTIQFQAETQSYLQTQALGIAEGGIDKAIYELNSNPNFAGESSVDLGAGQFSTTVSSIDANSKEITSTGYVPNSSNPTQTKTVRVIVNINSVNVAFNFGVQVGEGGLQMSNNSQVNGNVYSNGNITGSGTITSDAVVAQGTASAADQSWETQNSDFFLGNTAARTNAAQSFVPSTSANLNKVSLYLKKVGSPTDLSLKILTNDSGSPSKSVVATGTIPASTVTGNYAFIDGTFASSPTLNQGQTYWIVLVASNSASNYFSWGYDNASGYSSGTAQYSNDWNAKNPVWQSVGGDFAFKTYMGGVDTYISGVNVGGNAKAHSLLICAVTGNAYYSQTNTCTVGGALNSGQADPSPQAMPISDAQITDWEDTASAGSVIVGNHTVSTTETLGPAKIDGDLVVNGILTLSGPVWVKGNINFSNGAKLYIDPSLKNSGAILLADYPSDQANKGVITLSNNVILSGNGSSGSYPMVITTNSSNNALILSNNTNGAIFYASEGTIKVSNNAQASQLTGYSIDLSNNATITYSTGLANAQFSNGPGGSWAFQRGSYSIVK